MGRFGKSKITVAVLEELRDLLTNPVEKRIMKYLLGNL